MQGIVAWLTLDKNLQKPKDIVNDLIASPRGYSGLNMVRLEKSLTQVGSGAFSFQPLEKRPNFTLDKGSSKFTSLYVSEQAR
jgi:hypothetical protein